jgi:hypothetical protein
MTSPDFRALLRATETARMLADLEAATAGRTPTRDEQRRITRYRARLTQNGAPK